MELEDGVGGTFLGDGERGGHRGWLFATYIFGGVKGRNECSARPTRMREARREASYARAMRIPSN